MSIVCALVGHSASAKIIRNAAHSFSSCARCKADLVEADDEWTAAPAGFRIVWKERAAEAPPPTPVEELCTPFEAVLELTEPLPPPVRTLRKENDRRRPGGQFPSHFKGIDRRRGHDRRNAFGKKPAIASE